MARDIELPNRSGVVDPRIAREAELQRQRAYLAREQAPTQQEKRKALIEVLRDGFRAVSK